MAEKIVSKCCNAAIYTYPMGHSCDDTGRYVYCSDCKKTLDDNFVPRVPPVYILVNSGSELMPRRPKVITMCGSTRFADLMAVISWEFEKLGYIVLRVNFVPDWYVKKAGWSGPTHGAEQDGMKKDLDNLHMRKIDMSDMVFCCNANNYIGESTTNELAYAKKTNKPIYAIYGFNEQDQEGKKLREIATRMETWWIDARE